MAYRAKTCHCPQMEEKTSYEIECKNDKLEWQFRSMLKRQKDWEHKRRFQWVFDIIMLVVFFGLLLDFVSEVMDWLKTP